MNTPTVVWRVVVLVGLGITFGVMLSAALIAHGALPWMLCIVLLMAIWDAASRYADDATSRKDD